MKTVVLAIFMVFVIASFASALEVSQIVFSITSTAKTSTANLRITPMTGKLANWNGSAVQSFVLDGTAATNYFLTKTQTYTIPKKGAYWFQVDQNTTMKKNSESTFMKLLADVDYVFVIE